MNDEILELVNEEIKDELSLVRSLQYGSDEYQTAINTTTKLMDKQIEMEKLRTDNEHKLIEMKSEKKDRIVKNVLNGVGIVGGFALTVWGTVYSTKFEQDGSYTTIMGRGFISKLLPKK